MDGSNRNFKRSLFHCFVAPVAIVSLISFVSGCASTQSISPDAQEALQAVPDSDTHKNGCFELEIGGTDNGQLVCPTVTTDQ